MNPVRTALKIGAVTVAMVFGIAACGSDGDDSAKKAKRADATALAAYCKLAKAVNNLQGFPTKTQLQNLRRLAPSEIQGPARAAADPLIAAGDDPVAQFNAFAEDSVEEAIDAINAFDAKNCGLEADGGPGAGAEHGTEADAARVDVTMTEYKFEVDGPIASGRTSFVATNEGSEAHFLALMKLADGTTLEQALQSEDEKLIVGEWSTRIAAAGGDEESMTLDLAPGNYGMVCFIAGPDGTPHAFQGMQYEFAVT